MDLPASDKVNVATSDELLDAEYVVTNDELGDFDECVHAMNLLYSWIVISKMRPTMKPIEPPITAIAIKSIEEPR